MAEPSAGDGSVTHPYLMFATVALALMMASLDQTIVATALPALQTGLDAPITWTGWTITAYSLGQLLMLMPAGQLSERFGRRRIFLMSAAVFTGASLGCGIADNIYLLVALRFCQALGGAGFTPSATGIIVDHFGSGRDKAVGLFGTIFPIGGMAGPVVGGLLVHYWSWRGIFFVNVPIGVALMLMCVRFVPADPPRPPRRSPRRGRLDIVGAGLLGVAASGLMVALSMVGNDPRAIASTGVIVSAVAGLVAVFAFARHISRAADPLVPPRFVIGRGFGPVNVVNLVFNGLRSAAISLLPLYAVTRFSMTAIEAGTLLTAQAVCALIVSPIAVASLRRTGYRLPIYLGGTIMALGTVGIAFAPQSAAYGWLAVCGGLIGLGGGILSPASRNAGLQLEPSRSSSLAALRTMGGQTGSIVGISVMTALIAAGSSPAHTQAILYVAIAAVFVATMPVVSRVTEHHGNW